VWRNARAISECRGGWGVWREGEVGGGKGEVGRWGSGRR